MSKPARSLPSLLALLLAVACGGATPPSASSAAGDPGAPGGPTGPAAVGVVPAGTGTPSAAPSAPGAPAPGFTGSNRFQMAGYPRGLYIVEPAAGEPTVLGYVVVTLGPVSGGSFIPPADTVVTINGVALLRDPRLNGAYWRVDPASPQPEVHAGGQLVVEATATLDAGTPKEAVLSRQLVLPCPSDVEVGSTPAPGDVLTPEAAPARPLHLDTSADITLNSQSIPLMAGTFPTAQLFGYDPATRTISGFMSAQNLVTPGPLSIDLPVTPGVNTAPATLMELRWPGPWLQDGESGGFCGLVKRWVYQ